MIFFFTIGTGVISSLLVVDLASSATCSMTSPKSHYVAIAIGIPVTFSDLFCDLSCSSGLSISGLRSSECAMLLIVERDRVVVLQMDARSRFVELRLEMACCLKVDIYLALSGEGLRIAGNFVTLLSSYLFCYSAITGRLRDCQRTFCTKLYGAALVSPL